ncbi:MAG: penicillin-binding protein [Bacteroidetes bacterium]|nr:MAG: penicillin-binding protein [Bacteroidota bacterium]
MQVYHLRLFKRLLKYFAMLISAVLLMALLFFLSVYAGIFGALPDKAELAEIRNEEASLVYSADNIIIGKFFAENRTNISLDEIPEHLKYALIATEDKRFFTHRGYDLKSYFRVFFKSILFGNNKGGGSTITQQLIKNLYGRSHFGFLTTPVNKVREIIIAVRLEKVYTKEEIILLYLNSVPFGEDVYGVETAARRFFNKSASELQTEESAVLIGSLKASTHFNPKRNPENAISRRNLVLRLMEDQQFLLPEVADSLRKLPLTLDYANISLSSPAGYFVYQVKMKALELLEELRINTGKEYSLNKDGLRVYTTLDMKIQGMADSAVKTHMKQMQKLLDKELDSRKFKKQWYDKQRSQSATFEQDKQKRDMEVFEWDGFQSKNISRLDSLWHYYSMLNAAVLVTNPKNGAVISWIGGNNFRTLPFDMVKSHRQIASAFKPFVYATALESGVEPCEYLENEVKSYPQYEGWEPKNADHTSTPDSSVALWFALAHSMNLPTIDLFFRTGSENIINTCNKLDFPNIVDDAPSIAIGTLDLSLFEIVRAYGAFANQGNVNDLVMIKKITDAQGNLLYVNKSAESVEVFSKETSQQVTAILQQVINQGTGSKMRGQYGIRSEIAGKTGTAQNYSDAWFIAYTPDLVVGTWVGARTPDVHFFSSKGAGSSLALPIVAQVFSGIEKDAGLNRRYLTPFGFSDEVYAFLQCDPYRQKGIKGFFERLFEVQPDQKPQRQVKDKREQKSGEDSFFKRLFKKKK